MRLRNRRVPMAALEQRFLVGVVEDANHVRVGSKSVLLLPIFDRQHLQDGQISWALTSTLRLYVSDPKSIATYEALARETPRREVRLTLHISPPQAV